MERVDALGPIIMRSFPDEEVGKPELDRGPFTVLALKILSWVVSMGETSDISVCQAVHPS